MVNQQVDYFSINVKSFVVYRVEILKNSPMVQLTRGHHHQLATPRLVPLPIFDDIDEEGDVQQLTAHSAAQSNGGEDANIEGIN